MDKFRELESWIEKGYVLIVVSKNKILHKSKEGGVVALCKLIKNDRDLLNGAIVMDKIVGQAAAKLLVYGNVKKVITLFLSKGAKGVLTQNEVEFFSKNLVENILDKEKKSTCLMDRLSFKKSAIEICDIVLKNEDVL